MSKITRILNRVEDAKHSLKELEKNVNTLWNENNQLEDFYLSLWDNRLGYEIKTLDDLTEARKIAKKLYPDWKDEIESIWSSGDSRLAAWRDKRYPGFEIRLCTRANEFPADKLGKSERCGFVKVTKEDYMWECSL